MEGAPPINHTFTRMMHIWYWEIHSTTMKTGMFRVLAQQGARLSEIPGNDETVIIAQLHAIFLRLHNRVVDTLGGRRQDFATAQQVVRWHYQWAILYDFLRRIVNEETYDEVLPHVARRSNIVEHPPQTAVLQAPRARFHSR